MQFEETAAVRDALRQYAEHTWSVLSTPAELVAALPEIEFLFAPTPPRQGWGAAKRLRLLQLAGVGADLFLPAPELPESVFLCNARGVFAAEAAEYAIAAMLALWRRIPTLLTQQAAHRWSREPAPLLRGRTLAVLGLGAIGQRVAQVGAALGMEVVGARRRPVPTPPVTRVVGPDGIPDLVTAADCIVVALPRTEATQGVLGRDVLARLRPGAVVVVISRAGIVDADALTELASDGHLRGVALDVFDREPLPAGDPLWDRARVLISPHEAGFGEDYFARALRVFVENAGRIARGESPRNIVDPRAGY